MPTEVEDRLRDLRAALQSKVAENDEIIAAVDVEGENVSVTTEQAETFRKNLDEADKIKGQISLYEGQSDLHKSMDSASDPSVAAAAAAAAAGNGSVQLRKTL